MSITKYINLGKDKALTGVSGGEGLYNPFYRFFVLRKRQELISPRFFNMGDIVIPYNSVFHYLPNDVNSGYRGPGNHEPFISNYDKDVYIEFFSDFAEFETMGSFRRVIMEERKEIKAYRANHFNYKYTRNIESALRKEKNLIIRNYALIDKRMVYRPHMFINYFIYYNRTNNLIENINLEAERSNRHQFIRLDLGNRLFSWQELMVDYDAYCNAFKNGKYEPTNRSLRITKADNSYWILDFMSYLLGDYRYSVYGKLSEKAASNLHILITHNAKVLVIKYALLKEWLDNITTDPLADKPEEWKDGSRREFSTKRVNVTKRLYLLLLNMVNGATTEEQLTEETLEVLNEKEEEREDVQRLVPTTENKETGDRGTQGGDREKAPDVDNSADTNNVNNDKQGTKRSNEEHDRDQTEETGDDEGGEASADQYSISWDSEVDDKLLEVEEVKEVEQVVEKEVFKTPISGIERALKNKARDGTLTVREQEYFLERSKRYKEIKMENGQTMEEFMEIKPDTIDSLKEDAKIKGNFVTVLDESMLQSRSGALKKGYVEKILDKHLVQMVVGIQNAGIVVNDFKKETIVGVEGSYDILNIQMQPVGGSVSTIHVRLPKVLSDSTFVVDGVKNHMQLQRMELPIRKIAPNLVVLTSYYPSKIMVSRDERTVNDISYWLPKQLIKLSVEEDSKISFDRGSAFNPKLKPPRIISALSKKFKWVKVGNITLDFRFDLLIEKHPEFKKYNKPDSFLIGVNRGEPITIDNFGVLRIGNKEHGTIEEFLGVDTSKMPKEFCVVNISGYKYPVGVLLCYYFGIDELLKVLKTNYRVEPVGPRLLLGPDEYALTFSDEHLIFNRRDSLSTLVFAGLAKFKNLRNFSRTDLNSQGIWVPLIDDVKVKPSHFTEMNNLFDLFIDPITKAELTKLKYSTSFHHLLIDAVKLLETDFSLAGSDITEQRIVGYERITGHLYREMCNSVRAYRNKGNSRKFKLEMNPDVVLAKILTDTSVALVEQVNPIHELKDQEELTFGGVGGRNEISVVLRDRIKLAGDKGILGEGGKDSGKAGFVNYLTADPRITDYSGNIATNEKTSITGLRTSTGNLAVSTARDDPKRALMTSTQASQAVTSLNYGINTIRTGYETVLSHRSSELYNKIAKQDGKVTEVTNNHIKVIYKDGKEDTYPLGLVIGEASGEYHRHERVTNLKVGDKFKEGDSLGHNTSWFMSDPFNPGQVAWKGGKVVRVALVEVPDTYEDSLGMSRKILDEFITPYIRPRRTSLGIEQNLVLNVKVGDEVDYDQILCEIEDPHVSSIGEDSMISASVNKLGIKQIRAPVHGKIIRIEAVYNADLGDMSEGLRKVVANLEKQRVKEAKHDNLKAKSGRISNVNVSRPMVLPGRVLITFFIESRDPSTSADKYVVGNQMKGTVGTVLATPIYTEDGREVDVIQSFKGVFARMVLSIRDKLAAGEYSTGITKQALEIYRGKK